MEFLVMVAVVLVFICTFVKIAAAKDGTSLWTAEQIQNARENVKRYDWAKAELAVERRCEPWLAMSDEEIWSIVHYVRTLPNTTYRPPKPAKVSP